MINLAAALLAALWLALVAATVTPAIDDFEQYWQAAVNIRTSGDPYATTLEPGAVRDPALPFQAPFPNPPLLAYLMLPLAALPAERALMVWYGLNTLMLAGFLALALRMCGAALARRWWGVVALLLVVAPPTRVGLQLGQVSILLALLATLAYGGAARRAPLSGVALALGALIKLYPGFLGLFFLRHGPRRAAWWGLGAGLGLLGGSLLLHGPGPYAGYLRKVLLGGFYPYAAEFNISLAGFFQRLLVPSSYGLAVADAPGLAWGLTLAAGLLVLGACLGLGAAASESGRLVRYGAYLCAMLLLSPVNGSYNLVLLLIPALAGAWALEIRPDRRLGAALIGGLALACIPPGWSVGTLVYDTVHTGWGLLALSPALYGVLLVFGVMVALARRSGCDRTH